MRAASSLGPVWVRVKAAEAGTALSVVERHRRELRCPPVMGLGRQKALVTPLAGRRGPSPTCGPHCSVSLWLPDGCGSF